MEKTKGVRWSWLSVACGLAFVASSCGWAGDAETRKVVIVTGIDYPGHKWKETAPALAGELRKDPRLKVDVVEKPEFLASEKLRDYSVVVLHFMNWETPDPGEQARQNLARFVKEGGGVVAVHFACGAFQGWPEFEKIIGRIYDPKLRGHDPHGSFRVTMTEVDHPITHGLKDFEITDELYTCLAGQLPIQVLAEAKSKVDGKNYPMAFILKYGKGRVFHSPLGHDVVAFTNPGAAELFRRGCAWAAGLSPVPTAKAKKIAFLAGKPSHGPGNHEWDRVARFVKECLQQATNIEPPQIDVYDNGWPANPAALDDVDAVVFFADGREMHPLAEPGRLAKIRELAKRGTGIMFVHYSIDPPAGAQADLMAWMGGCYEAGYSQNPVNVVKVTPVGTGHPITRGCSGYVAEDEWYFDIRFRPNDANVVPIMTGKLPPRNPQDKVLAWAYTRPDGGRGFGFAGGHYTSNWHMEPFRKLVLNAILWVAKAEVPKDGVASAPTWRFVSIPNFTGADLAYPQPGWEETLDYVLKAIKAENPEFVLVPGDLVAGRWPDKAAIEKQAAAQYAAWMKRMAEHGLPFYAGVGDHEIGGRPWSGDKAALVPLFKRQFQRYLNMPRNGPLRLKGTAYSFVHENALFIALDVFERGSGAQAGIVPQVTGEQLQWLEQTLADNPGVEHVVAMGHTPILGVAAAGSPGALTLAGGRESPAWQAFKKRATDLYLCGETQAVACTQADGILQVAHGGLWNGPDGRAAVSYLVATVYPGRIDLELKQIAIVKEGSPPAQVGDSGPSEKIRIADNVEQKGFTTVGTAVLHRDQTGWVLSNATGVLGKATLP
jgi:type 1 glutamine amidotransferase